jgi:hypothetical protein
MEKYAMSRVIQIAHQEDVRLKATVITLAVAAITFPLTFVLWPPEIPPYAPDAAQILGLGLVAAETLAMGGGVAFLILGYRALKRLPVRPPYAIAAYLGIGFYLINWWTHDHLHAVADRLDFNGWLQMTVALEYVFHAGMMVFGAVLALFFAKVLLATASTRRVDRGDAEAEEVAS